MIRRAQEYDVSQFDAFCLCLEIGKGPSDDSLEAYDVLCKWLLDLSIELIRPDFSDLRLEENCTAVSHPGQDMKSDELPDNVNECNLAVEKRFRFFLNWVRRARIWSNNDGVLFQMLQNAASDLMDDVAILCDQRCWSPHFTRIYIHNLFSCPYSTWLNFDSFLWNLALYGGYWQI